MKKPCIRLNTRELNRVSNTNLSILLSGIVHTRVEVRGMDLEMSRLVERPWLQLMCAICLLYGHNFRCWEEVQDGSEC